MSNLNEIAHRHGLARAIMDASLTLGETTLRFEALDPHVEHPLSRDDRWEKLVGRSSPMRKLFAMVPKLAGTDATLLIEGETGTGKSVLAEAIHRASPRAAKPWVVVDCSTIPPTLVESVLFGYDKGAFTGATTARPGAFEAANGGTVLLDEIGELPSDMQPKLLRLLETRTVTRIGRVDPIALDVRILAATNRDLREMVNRGTFRSDLFYRLNVIKLRIPPLRERREDIPVLCAQFFADGTGGTLRPAEEQFAAFVHRDWPGNIRELRHAVENAVLLDELGPIADDSPADQSVFETRAAFDPTLPFRDAKEQITAQWERWYLRELITRTGGNLSRAAREAQMDRRYLRDLLRRHAIQHR